MRKLSNRNKTVIVRSFAKDGDVRNAVELLKVWFPSIKMWVQKCPEKYEPLRRQR